GARADPSRLSVLPVADDRASAPGRRDGSPGHGRHALDLRRAGLDPASPRRHAGLGGRRYLDGDRTRMTSTASPAVRLQAVSKRFGDHAAVETVTLSIAQGEFFSLLGPSGCGKTTTLRILAGFAAPTAGSVFLNEEEITERPAHLRKIGMVFQHYALFPHLSVFENIAFPLRLRRTSDEEIRQRISQALEMVRLPALAARMPAQLSG